ncbi:MAG TPA: hypothetical protein VGR57_04730, partial [Ktedonobacterales bacterium]|nr:hypothetical protein [Ktedonobacterales bacterium]
TITLSHNCPNVPARSAIAFDTPRPLLYTGPDVAQKDVRDMAPPSRQRPSEVAAKISWGRRGVDAVGLAEAWERT